MTGSAGFDTTGFGFHCFLTGCGLGCLGAEGDGEGFVTADGFADSYLAVIAVTGGLGLGGLTSCGEILLTVAGVEGLFVPDGNDSYLAVMAVTGELGGFTG